MHATRWFTLSACVCAFAGHGCCKPRSAAHVWPCPRDSPHQDHASSSGFAQKSVDHCTGADWSVVAPPGAHPALTEACLYSSSGSMQTVMPYASLKAILIVISGGNGVNKSGRGGWCNESQRSINFVSPDPLPLTPL